MYALSDENIALRALQKMDIKIIRNEFRYMKSGFTITIRWDGAGILRNGKIVLIEVEKSELNINHVWKHMFDLVLMIGQGTSINKIIWITLKYNLSKLKEMIRSWATYYSLLINIILPEIEYRAINEFL